MSFYYGDEIEIEKIKRRSFEIVAKEVGLSAKTVLSAFDNIADKLEKACSARLFFMQINIKK